MAVLGSIATALTLNSDPFVRGFAGARREMMTFSREVTRFRQTTSGRGGFVLQEVSRGFEDFAISASTGGIAAGLRGATNNVNAFLSRFGALGAIASILVTVGTTVYSYFSRTKDSAKEATDELARHREELLKTLKAAEKFAEFRIDSSKFKTSEDTQKAIDERNERVRALAVREGKFQGQFAAANDQGTRDALIKEQQPLFEERKRLENELAELRKQRDAQVTEERRRAFEKQKGDEALKEEALAKKRIELEREAFRVLQDLRGRGAATGARSVDFLGGALAPDLFGEFKRQQDIERQRRDLAGSVLPDDLKFGLNSLLTQAALTNPAAQAARPFASATQAGSAAAFKDVFRINEEKNQKNAQEQALRKLTEIATKLESIKRAIEDDARDDVNLE